MSDIRWSFQPAAAAGELWARWDDFNGKTFNTPLLRSCFLLVTLRHFGSGKEILAIASDDKGIAAACLLDTSNSPLAKTFAPPQLPICPWLQRADLNFADIAAALATQLPMVTLLASCTSLDPRFVPPPAQGPRIRTLPHVTTGAIDLPADFGEYLETRSKKAVANAHRRIRKAEAEFGKPWLKIITDPAEVANSVDTYADLESSSWKAARGTALVRGDAQTAFYKQALSALCDIKIGRIYELYFGPRIAAMELAILDGSVAYMLKTTYDVTLHSCSPGILLKWYLIQSMFDEEKLVRRLEHYGPLNESQVPWITESREMYHANVYRYPVLARLHSLSQKLRYRRVQALH
ncbi:MAG: GNAT family N-acetyltransferase [Rhodocyclaceae bacterium]|nr:GNAT family N-acetyltransferase [Rhodocyclaceae bacterium]